MAAEVLECMDRAPPGWIVDCTAGGGGHSAALLARRSDVSVLALDRDVTAVAVATARLAPFGPRAVVVHSAFSALVDALKARQIGPLAGLLADLGVSSHQLDNADRGFSIRRDGPLDMRMDTTRGQPLADRLASISERDLADVLFAYGDIRASRKTAAAVLAAWRDGVRGTADFAERIAKRMAGGGRTHPATRVFQALRMWVNDEPGELEALLTTAPPLLAPAGVMAVISFHSGEDRQVKRAFRDLARGKQAAYELVTRKPLTPTDVEARANPRARSASLRILRRQQNDQRDG